MQRTIGADKKSSRKNMMLFCVAVFLCMTIHGNAAEGADFRKKPYILYDQFNTGIKVLWQTDETPINSQVEWGQVLPYEFGSGALTESGSGENEHQFTYAVINCEPGTHYLYRVTVDSVTFTGSFNTAPQDSADSVTVYGYGDTRSQPLIQNNILGVLLEDINTDPFGRQTILLHSGDWVNAGDSEEDWDTQFFNSSYLNTVEVMSRLAVMGCRGTHEQSGGLLRKYWPYAYQDASGSYYSFDYGPVHVTVVDQYDSFLPGSDQYNWIDSDLAGTRKPWKLVLLHEPAWSAGGGHANDTDTQNYLCPLFENYKVAIVQQGHNHYYARNQVNGIQYLTTGGGGAPLYSPDSAAPHLVVSDENYHFVRYDVSDEKMTVKAVRDDASLIDQFEISIKGVVCPDIGTAETVGTIDVATLDEISGIAASRKNNGILWVHNDYPGAHPEDANKIYAITAGGSIVAGYTISTAPAARDPEDIAVGPGPLNGPGSPAAGHYIYWGDIGDNSSQYAEIRIKRIPEPTVDPNQAFSEITLGSENGVEVITLEYPSGADAPSHKDAETLMVDPLTGDIYIVTKRMSPNKVYKASYPQSTIATTIMDYVATLPDTPGLTWITGGDISPDGSAVIIRNDGITDYVNIWYRELNADLGSLLERNPCLVEIDPEPQGEAVGFDSLGESFYTVSEAHNPTEPIRNYALTWGYSNENINLIDRGSLWKFIDDGSDQGSAWKETGFDDTSWTAGSAELGYGDGDEATVVSYGSDSSNKYITTYFRKTFEVENATFFRELMVSIKRDDGAVMFLNGTEVLRSHMPEEAVSFDTLASSPAVSGSEESIFFDTDVDQDLLTPGMNTIAVEIHQQAATSSDISMDLELIGKNVLNTPAVSTLQANSINSTSAILTVEVNPLGSGTNAYFECITVNNYATISNAVQTPLTGTETQRVNAKLSDLAPDTTYHFRVKAVNDFGTSYGETKTFTTSLNPIPVVYVNKDDGTCGGNSPCYLSVQEAIDEAAASCTIEVSQGIYSQIWVLDALKTITISGCWDALFLNQYPHTTIIKAPSVPQGTLILRDVVIQP